MSVEILKLSNMDEIVESYLNISPDNGVFTWDEIEKNTKEELEEFGDYNPPMIFLNSKKGRIAIALQFDNDFEKNYTKIKLRNTIHRLEVDRYWFVAISWFAEKSNLRPSKNPNRKEILVIEEHEMGGSKTKFLFFSRSGNKIVWGKVWNFEKEGDIRSSWNFFKEDITKEHYNNKINGNGQ